MIKFEAGKTYTGRSVCDSECIIRVEVASRTPKTIRTTSGKLLRVGQYRDAEFVMPWGRYSMAPIVTAERPL